MVENQHFLEEVESLCSKLSGLKISSEPTKFEAMDLSYALMKGLYAEMKFENPSVIQSKCLPKIIERPFKSLVVEGYRGTGKTCCFIMAMLNRIDPCLTELQAICACPSRRVAKQILEVLQKMGTYTGVRSELALAECMYRRGRIQSHAVIGTLDTIHKWIKDEKLCLDHIRMVVFDESDLMFAETLIFASTSNETIKMFLSTTFKDSYYFQEKEHEIVDSVKQFVVFCPNVEAQTNCICQMILEIAECCQVIVFTERSEAANKLHRTLAQIGYEVTSVHVDRMLPVAVTDRLLEEFKDKLSQILISKDMFARGFDCANVNLVINLDIPINHHTWEPHYNKYCHRMRRTGRFGSKGAVFNVLLHDALDKDNIGRIERATGAAIKEILWNSEEDFASALREAGL